MVEPRLLQIDEAIREIQTSGPDIPRLRSFLSACGFRERARKPPFQRLAPDRSAVLAFPENEKPIAFFPLGSPQRRWQEDVYPCLGRCWDRSWTGIQRPTGRAFLVTGKALWAYVVPVPPQPDVELDPVHTLDFSRAQEWSRELPFLTSDTIHASSYWQFLSTPTARTRQLVGKNLVDRLEQWSSDLAKELAKRRQSWPQDKAEEAVRRILDQLLFVRFCEDRHVTTLEKTLFDFRGGSLNWRALRTLIGEYEHILNGDVFAPGAFEDGVVPGDLIQSILLELYQDFTFESIPSEVLGRTYEQRLARRLDWNPPDASYVEDQNLRKQLGIYYTPESVAGYLAKRALEIWSPVATKPIEQVRWLDMCAGSGTFLVQGFRALINELRSRRGGPVLIEERAKLLGDCICGLDVQPLPLERSALACYLEALSGQGVASGQRLLPRMLGSNLRQGDACDLSASLSSCFQADIILLNPPYTGHRSASAPCWRILREAVAHLPENGVLGAIVPDALLRNTWLRDLRKSILDSTAIEEFGLIRTRVFEGPNIRPILLLLRKVRAADARMAHVPRSVFIRSIEPQVKADPIARTANQASLVRRPFYPFNVHVPDAITDMQTRLLNTGRFRALRDFVECMHGVVNPPRDAVYKKDTEKSATRSTGKVYLKGRDIQLFRASWSGWFIDYPKAQEGTKGTKNSARYPELFEAPCKLLVRESGNIIRACLDFEHRYADNKVILCLPNPGTCDSVRLHFLLGYLNSEIGWLWFALTNPQDPGLMPTIRQAELEELWVPSELDRAGMTQVAVLSHRIAQTLASGYIGVDDPLIMGMRRQLLARIARLLDLSDRDADLVLEFLDERHSVAERPFKYPRRIPPVPVVELPPRPLAEQDKGGLWDGVPLSDQERRKKADWEDIINGPLPDIYEHEVDEDDLRLGKELRAFEERLARIESLLEREADG